MSKTRKTIAYTPARSEQRDTLAERKRRQQQSKRRPRNERDACRYDDGMLSALLGRQKY